MLRFPVFLLVSAALLAGCASPPPPDFSWFPAAASWHPWRPVEAVAGAEVAPGFDAADKDAPIAVGDEIVYDIAFESPEGEERWTMCARVVRVLGSPRDGIAELKISVYGADGSLRGTSRARVSIALLAYGVFTLGERTSGNQYCPRDEVEPIVQRTSRVLWKMLGIVRRNHVLAPILWKIVRKPPAVSLLLHLGLRFRLTLTRSEYWGKRLPGSDQWVPTYRVPLVVMLNDTVSLRCSIVCTRSISPYLPCAGLISIVAERPDGSGTRLRMRLVAARRGGRRASGG